MTDRRNQHGFRLLPALIALAVLLGLMACAVPGSCESKAAGSDARAACEQDLQEFLDERSRETGFHRG